MLKSFSQVYQIMTVAAEPDQIFYFVIFSVVVFVVYNQNFFIFYLAIGANWRRATFFHNAFVDIFTIFPIWVFFAAKFFVSPFGLAGFSAKEFTAFRIFDFFWFFPDFFAANITRNKFPPFLSYPTTLS